jgi:hypothetical protein
MTCLHEHCRLRCMWLSHDCNIYKRTDALIGRLAILMRFKPNYISQKPFKRSGVCEFNKRKPRSTQRAVQSQNNKIVVWTLADIITTTQMHLSTCHQPKWFCPRVKADHRTPADPPAAACRKLGLNVIKLQLQLSACPLLQSTDNLFDPSPFRLVDAAFHCSKVKWRLRPLLGKSSAVWALSPVDLFISEFSSPAEQRRISTFCQSLSTLSSNCGRQTVEWNVRMFRLPRLGVKANERSRSPSASRENFPRQNEMLEWNWGRRLQFLLNKQT